MVSTSVLPANSRGYKLDNIDKAKQYRDLNQRPDGGSQRLIAVCTKSCDSDGNSKLKIIAGGGEALSGSQLITKPEFVSHKKSDEEDDDEINDERSGNSND